jgi:hypothetical protein
VLTYVYHHHYTYGFETRVLCTVIADVTQYMTVYIYIHNIYTYARVIHRSSVRKEYNIMGNEITHTHTSSPPVRFLEVKGYYTYIHYMCIGTSPADRPINYTSEEDTAGSMYR